MATVYHSMYISSRSLCRFLKNPGPRVVSPLGLPCSSTIAFRPVTLAPRRLPGPSLLLLSSSSMSFSNPSTHFLLAFSSPVPFHNPTTSLNSLTLAFAFPNPVFPSSLSWAMKPTISCRSREHASCPFASSVGSETEMREEPRREGGKGQESAREKTWVTAWRRDLTCIRVRRRVMASGSVGSRVVVGASGPAFPFSSSALPSSLMVRRPSGTNCAIAGARIPVAEMDSVSERASPRRSSIS